MRKNNRAIIYFVIAALAVFFTTGAILAEENNGEAVPDTVRAHQARSNDGHLERGGKAIGNGYGHAGKEFGLGTADFATSTAKADFGDAGKAMGRGGAEFGKGIGKGTAKGFKHFGLAFVTLGKKIDHAVSNDGES